MFTFSLILTIILWFTYTGKSIANINLTVDLGYSVYQGVDEGNFIAHWLGIRYAAPPLGDLRFRGPKDPVVDETLHIADTKAYICKHGGICLSSPSSSLDSRYTEDCLFLDVYAPTRNTRGPKPVFVWFQGGGFNSLANPNQSGSNLIQNGDYGIVFVTFNYRVGLYGFLASQEVQENGNVNAGLLDQRKVLEWVQKYIHLFGGDPSHVTIGGASAGAASVTLHLSAYGGRDDGLFHAAVAESQSFGAQLTVSESQYQYDALVQRVGCDTVPDTLQCLRDLDVDVLAQYNSNIPTPGGAGSPPLFMYSNVIDGDFTVDYTYKLYSEGKFVKVPVIFGDDTNEGTMFAPKTTSNYQQMNSFLKNNFVKLTPAQLATIDTLYPPAETFPNSGPYWRTASNAYGEMRYNCPGIYLSSTYPSHGVPQSWNYHYDYATPANALSGLGVYHTSENSLLWGDATNPLGIVFQMYWISFIRSKDPNTYKLPSAPEWTTFDGVTMGRILFPDDPMGVKMEMVPVDQQTRCVYLSSIGAGVGQ
ncbi:Lipase [Lachnellula suecica]|uniref:Carboxylic ester hydrolase n=1 Tax=Lachnellula suecica TaxID=602035 RepID=A0A8T9BYF7_9HELO|nr:Lipase [Lachnellula suecica]